MKDDAKILVIDDSSYYNGLTSRFLGSILNGCKIKCIENGTDALKYLFETTSLPDFILLDILMPGHNGIEVLQILKNDEELRNIPVVVLTGCNINTTIALNSTLVLQKPDSPCELKSILEHVCALLLNDRRALRVAA